MKKFIFHTIVIVTLVCQLIPVQKVNAIPVTPHSNTTRQLDQLRDDSSVVIAESADTGAVTFIGSNDGSPVLEGSSSPSALPTEKSTSALQKYAPLFGINDYKTDLFLMSSKAEDSGRTNIRYQQVYKGIPVMAGEIIMNMSSTGSLYSMSGEASPDLAIDTKTQIDPAEASRQAAELMTARYGVAEADVRLTDPELWIYDERLLKPSTLPAELVYRFEATSAADKSLNILILVNAVHGGIRLQFNQIDTDTTGQTWKQPPLAQEGPTTEVPVIETTEPPTETPTVTPSATETPTETPTGTPTELTAEPTLPDPLQYDGTGVTWYVATTGLDTNDCLSPTTPCLTIQGAIDKALSGDIVNVAGGTYFGSETQIINIIKNITLRGGWDSLFTTQNNQTIIDGQGQRRGILIPNSNTIVFLEKIWIKNAYSTSNGGGIYASNSTLTIINSSISNSYAPNGSALCSNNSDISIKNSTISGNLGTNSGSIYLFLFTRPTLIQNSTITNNSQGIYIESPTAQGKLVTITNSIIAGNLASTNPDCRNTINNLTSHSYNLFGQSSGCVGSTGVGELVGVSAGVNPLESSKGIHIPHSGSLIIDSGSPANPGSGGEACELTDQLGTTRPFDGNSDSVAKCDIGAVELNDLSPSVASSLEPYSGNNQTIINNLNSDNTLTALVKDQFGGPVANISVTFTAPGSGSSGVFSDTLSNVTSVLSDANGLATAPTFKANSIAGAYSVEAAISGVSQPAYFNLENYSPTPSTLALETGNNQIVRLNTPLTTPLKVSLKDQYNRPINGVSITFSAPSSGPSGVFIDSGTYSTNATTDSLGYATAASFTSNGISGTYIINSMTDGIATPLNFNITNTSGNRYVSLSGSDLNDCLSPSSSCLTINKAISTASVGENINISEGIYTNSDPYVVSVTKNLSLIGGWNSDFTKQTGYSTIHGQTPNGGVNISGTVNNPITVNLDRFIIENGGYTANNNLLFFYAKSTITNSEIKGGIPVGVNISRSEVTFDHVQIHDNSDYYGEHGGIYATSNSSITINNSNIYDNQGSGIYTENFSALTITNTMISGNKSVGYGGGIRFGGGNSGYVLKLNNVTISGNQALRAGGIWSTTGTLDMSNSILAGNHALSESNCFGSFISKGYNLFGDLNGCTFTTLNSDQINSSIYLLPFANFGGNFASRAILRNSRATDNGNPATPGSGDYTCETVDQRGVTRPVNVNGSNVCDIGAFEYSNGAAGAPSGIYPLETSLIFLKGGPNSNSLQAVVLDSQGNGVPNIAVTFSTPLDGPTNTFTENGNNTVIKTTDINGIAKVTGLTANLVKGFYTIQASISETESTASFKMFNGIGIATYTMNHQSLPLTNLPGTLVCDISQPDCSNGIDTDADHAQKFAIDTIIFLFQHHGRNGLVDNGSSILNCVHYGTNYNNSFWDGPEAVFGDNQTTDDTVAHELIHGMTQGTSRLLYYYQSGAINESFSDLWGEFVDLTNDFGNDTRSVKWLLGEDNSTFRSMANPPDYSNPDKMTSSLYQYGDLENLDSVDFDNGGVHTNSGVNNKAVYLMTDGGTFNSYTITGLGLTKVAAIYYETQTHLLTSGSNYKDLYFAIHQACVNLVGGSDGITIQDCGEVQKALDAVEMNKDPLGTFIPQAQVCPANTQPSNIFFDDFESGISRWNVSDFSTSNSNWRLAFGYASSNLLSLYAPSMGYTSDSRASMATSVAIPSEGTTYLHFNHVFGNEYNPSQDGVYRTWDGEVLEYKIDEGVWQDASPLFDSGQGYNGSVYTSSEGTNPLAGRSGFVRDSHGFVSSRYKLDTAAIKGHAVNFRWRIGTDATVGDLGWSIDDVRIYQCQPAVPGNLILPDDFSTNRLWADSSSGSVTRDTANSILNFTSNQATPLHYSIPIHATNGPINLKFRFKINSSSGNSLLWIGLAHELDEISPAVSGADRAGTFIGIDSNNKIQFLSLYPDGSSTQVDSASSTLVYGGTQVWRNATLSIDQLNWTISVKDDNGSVVGAISGTLPTQQEHYDFLTLMYDNGGGTDSISGQIDDIYVYGTEQTPTFGDVLYSYTETLGGITYQLHPYIQALYNAGLTAGTTTNPPMYSPTLTLDRSMAAVFILRANYGTSYVPPAAPWTTFANESWANNAYAQKWAEGMYKAHLTAGCLTNPLRYCPDNTLPRVEGVVFALHMKYDYFDGNGNLVSYVPPAATGNTFGDMTDTSYWGTKWAEKAYLDGILPACGTLNGKPKFCPNDPVDRAWAAYMIVKARNLTIPE